ncbi:MAG: peptide MFS transporter [Alistipes sp.]|nr:peptide MFS transporter [Alistipes sp.]
MFKGHPKGLFALALANTGERFGYYTMVAVFALFLRANFGLDAGVAGTIYSTFLGLVYFMPLIGGILADKFGFGRMVTIGITIMFAGYLLLSVPLGGDTLAMVAMLGALVLISVGTGLFKGNLQVMVGNLYDDPKYADKRDSAFSLFYMAINIGALFAPTAAVEIKEWAETALGYSSNDAYHFSFAVACASLILSMAIYYIFRPTFRHVEGGVRKAGVVNTEEELSPAETKARVVALCLVFAVVIFFWMAFHQNGLALTYFADEFTAKTSEGVQSMAFNVWNLVVVIIAVYAAFSAFQSESKNGKIASWAVVLAAVAFLVWKALNVSGTVDVSAPIFQHFNPFYVVALTPVSMAIFGSLAKKGKEPSAPRKIAYGMLIAGLGFAVMAFGSMGLLTPDEQAAAGANGTFVSANWLISTYLVLTFAELLLSPMGISFVSKVAPPKLKGMMMGGWFVATAIGNMLVAVGGLLWGGLPLWIVWSVFIVLCLLSAAFMFAMMKRLESATK